MQSKPRFLNKYWRSVRTYEPEAVTTVADNEVEAALVGLRTKDVDAIWKKVVRLYQTGLHPAIGICIRRRGEILMNRTIGHSHGNAPLDDPDTPKVLATPDTLFNFFSGSKSVTAMLIHLLHERQQLHVDEPISSFIPDFARKRKHRITIRDVLTHRSGIPNLSRDMVDLDVLGDWDKMIALSCELEPISQPGKELAYHALTGGFVLGEIIRRVTGDDIRAFLTKEIRAPLGFKHFNYGVSSDIVDQVAQEAFTGPIPTWPHKNFIIEAMGFGIEELVDFGNDPRYRTGIIPSGNIIGTSEEVSRFFELLLTGGIYENKRIFKQRTVANAIKRQTSGEIDQVIRLPVPYSMGFMLGSKLIGFYGPRTGKAFGHLGFTNVLGWADPARDISVGFMNTGKPLIAPEMLAWLNVMRTISARIPRDRRVP